MTVENRWTWGNIVSLVALGSTILSVGVAWGTVNARMDKMEEGYRQASMDSRTLIEVSKDVAYIKDSIQAMKRMADASWSMQPHLSCPTEQPVLVASHCRSYPSLD